MRAACLVVLLFGCQSASGGPQPPPRPDPLAPLPAPQTATSDRFADSLRCAQCHLALEDNPDALRDAAGRDVSPVGLWRPSMMALAGRDPFFLAAWNQERSRFPDHVDEIDPVCARCHAPMGAVESDDQLGFEELVSGDTDAAALGRDGVSCSLCHQILPDNLGAGGSLSGGFQIGFGREIFGPHPAPDTDPMMFFVNYTPVQSDHITSSELCATCHTVVVEPRAPDGNPRGGELVEQATYFEWLNSSYVEGATESTPCAGCHLPTEDEDGAAIATRLAVLPDTLSPRTPFGRHLFVGGGAYLARLIGANLEWANAGLDAADLEAAAARSEAHLATAAELSLAGQAGGAGTEVEVEVKNLAGHKLPTGYPTRRMWLHLVARDAGGAVIFESGRPGDDGSLPGDGEEAVRPHLDVVDDASQVALWEAVLQDEDGRPTARPLAAVGYAKDTRILPAGFSELHPDIDKMRPKGAEDDSSFVPGSDTVRFEIPAAGPLSIEVELLYQSLSPAVAASHEAWPTPAGVRFSEMAARTPPAPVAIATATAEVP